MKKRRMTKRFKFILVVAAVAYALVIFATQETEFKKLQERSGELEAQLGDSRLKIEELQHKIDYSKTDEYAQKAARDTLGWVKDGELKFTVKQ